MELGNAKNYGKNNLRQTKNFRPKLLSLWRNIQNYLIQSQQPLRNFNKTTSPDQIHFLHPSPHPTLFTTWPATAEQVSCSSNLTCWSFWNI